MRLRPRFFLGGVIECSSRMKANFQVRFLEGWRPAMASGYSAKRFEENRGNRKLCHLNPFEFLDHAGCRSLAECGVAYALQHICSTCRNAAEQLIRRFPEPASGKAGDKRKFLHDPRGLVPLQVPLRPQLEQSRGRQEKGGRAKVQPP